MTQYIPNDERKEKKKKTATSNTLLSIGLTFRSLIHFEVIFADGVRESSNFIVLHVAVQFSWHHLLKTLSFLHCIVLPPLS